jgi:hypothetical protein
MAAGTGEDNGATYDISTQRDEKIWEQLAGI